MKIQKFNLPEISDYQLYIKREDLIHPVISGNKFWKLKYNLRQIIEDKYETLLTFGGAYSNHIIATACAGYENHIKTIGIIRGDELKNKPLNDTLLNAQEYGMKLYFLDRDNYRNKDISSLYITENYYLVPEGGTNKLAVKGTEEMMHGIDDFDFIFVPVGTGGTISGILNYIQKKNLKTHVYGICALKNGQFLKNEIIKYTTNQKYNLILDDFFGGYGKFNNELIRFINEFNNLNNIPLEPIYTGKMVYYLNALLQNNILPKQSKILCIHTGGLQGIKGINNHKTIIKC